MLPCPALQLVSKSCQFRLLFLLNLSFAAPTCLCYHNPRSSVYLLSWGYLRLMNLSPLILIQLCSHRICLKCKPATHNPFETFHSPTVKSISLTFFKASPDLTHVYLTCLISWYFLPETLLEHVLSHLWVF